MNGNVNNGILDKGGDIQINKHLKQGQHSSSTRGVQEKSGSMEQDFAQDDFGWIQSLIRAMP